MQTRIVKDEHPCIRCLPREPGDEPDPRDALRGSRRRNELRSAAQNDLELVRPSVVLAARLWRSVAARLGPNRTESRDQGRFSRRLVTGDALHDPKHLPPTSALLRARDRRSGVATFATVPGRPSTDSHEGIRARSRTRAQPQPCVRTSIGRPFAGICKQPKARARPAKRPNLARTGTFSAPERLPQKGCEPRNTRKTSWRPEGAGPASRRTTSQRVHEARRPADARRALTCHHSIHAMRLVNADVYRLAKARLESLHANATTFSEP